MSLLDTGKAAGLLRELDRKWAGDHETRRIELGRLRNAYFVEYIMRRLAALPENSGVASNELRRKAEQILSKAGSSSLAPEGEKRTALEERMLGAAKVMWHKLIKAEGVAPPRTWSKKQNGQAHGPGTLFRQLSDQAMTSEGGRLLLREYIAHQALQMLKLCERAKNMNPEFVTAEVQHHVAQLFASATKPSGR